MKNEEEKDLYFLDTAFKNPQNSTCHTFLKSGLRHPSTCKEGHQAGESRKAALVNIGLFVDSAYDTKIGEGILGEF